MGGSDLLSGTLEILLLKTIGGDFLHGYSISARIGAASDDVIKVGEGVLYPALHRLEAKGFLQAEWGVTDTGREAKFYGLTEAGRRRLAKEAARWTEKSAAVLKILAAE